MSVETTLLTGAKQHVRAARNALAQANEAAREVYLLPEQEMLEKIWLSIDDRMEELGIDSER